MGLFDRFRKKKEEPIVQPSRDATSDIKAALDAEHARLSGRIRDSAGVTAAAGKDPRESQQPVGGAGIGLGRQWEACGSVSIEDSASVTAFAERPCLTR